MDAPYELGESTQAVKDLKELRARAIERGMKREFLAALLTIAEKLQHDPIAWGDPEYELIKEGGRMFHVACNPLYIQYAVYELEKAVFLIRVTPMSSSGLE